MFKVSQIADIICSYNGGEMQMRSSIFQFLMVLRLPDTWATFIKILFPQQFLPAYNAGNDETGENI